MSLKSAILAACFIACGFAVLFAGALLSDDRQPAIINQKYEGLEIEYFNNSATASQALGINSSGSIFGSREDLAKFQNFNFFCGQDGCKEMPTPKGFTNVEALALSDTNLIVGRTTKAIGTRGSLRAVVWSPGKGEINLLPTPEGDESADACDITADGQRITGYATGPGRLRPVVWAWDATPAEWRVEVLPTEHEDNPYLMSSQLIIAPDGKTIVGCCTEKFLEDGTVDSSLMEWRRSDDKWTRRQVSEEAMHLKAINNKGQIAGSIAGSQGRMPCLITLDGTIKLLKLLEGDVAGEARDINEESVIVGWSDDPPGAEGGPTPCTWNLDGQATELKVNELRSGMLYAINGKGQIAGAAVVITKPATSETANDEESALLAVRISKVK